MAIPSTFSPVKQQDFTFKPLKVNKTFNINSSQLQTTSSGYVLLEAIYTKRGTQVGSNLASNDPINSVDGSYKSIVWKHIDAIYYRYPYTPGYTAEHSNSRYTFKHLNVSASVLHIPYLDCGELISPESVKITNTDTSIQLIDDGNGNLYDPELEQSFPTINRNNLIGYWGFNDLFREEDNPSKIINNCVYDYTSYIFTPKDNPTLCRNVSVVDGLEIDSIESGKAIYFNSTGSYALTPNNDNFNFDKQNEFVISFWMKPDSDTINGSLISKRGVRFESRYGKLPKVNVSSGKTSIVNHISSSYVDVETDNYPFDFIWDSDVLYFSRNDGGNEVLLVGNVSADTWTHISVIRYTSNDTKKIDLLVNGVVADTADDITANPINSHAIMFGSVDRLGNNQYIGALDELRFINTVKYASGAVDYNYYQSIANPNHAYNTSIAGNVFYRGGCIVISPLNPKYRNILSGNFNIQFKGTHIIYQYEVLCRIPKGAFNLSMNPTATVTPKSDILLENFNSSDSDYILRPYANSIGFYNTDGDLVAVGKFGQPIQMRDDVDINVLVKWDV